MTSLSEKELFLELLKEIQQAAHDVEPAVETAVLDPRTSPIVAKYSLLLAKINDTIALCEKDRTFWQDEEPSKRKFTVNLAQHLREFGESYASRYGEFWTSKLSIFVKQYMPVVWSKPKELTEYLDAIIRWGRAWGNPTGELHFEVSVSKKEADPFGMGEIAIRMFSPAFASHAEELQEMLQVWDRSCFVDGREADPMHIKRWGCDLFNALRTAHWLNAQAVLRLDNDRGVSLDFLFRMELNPRVHGVEFHPSSFCLHSENYKTRRLLRELAEFYGVQCHEVASLDVPHPELPLVYDASDYDEAELRKVSQIWNRERVLVLLPEKRLDTLRELATIGLCQTASFPVVSPHFMRSMLGHERFSPSEQLFGEEQMPAMKIAVVDDAPTARIVLRDCLEALGHTVYELFDGTHLVRMVEAGTKFDYIFCDLNMPHMDGISAVKRVRSFELAHNTRRPVPIILVTAYSELAAAQKALEAGFNEVIRKPINPEQIRRIITRHFTMTVLRKNHVQRTQLIDVYDLQRRCSGKERLMIGVLEAFMESSKECLLKLRESDPEENIVFTTQLIHTLKGLLRDAGASGAATTVEAIENKIKGANFEPARDIPTIESVVSQASVEAHMLKVKMQREIES